MVDIGLRLVIALKYFILFSAKAQGKWRLHVQKDQSIHCKVYKHCVAKNEQSNNQQTHYIDL